MAIFPNPFAGQTAQPQQPALPRVPWSQNPLITTAGLALLGGRNIHEGLANVAQTAPAGMAAKSGMQQFMLAQQERQAQKAEQEARKAQMNEVMKAWPGLSPEQRALFSAQPELFGEYALDTMKPQPGFRQATQEEAATYNAAAGQFGPDGRFYPLNPPSGMAIEADGQGGFRMVQGPGAGKTLTEGQSKDTVYSTRAEGALAILDQYDTELTSFPQRAVESDPTGILRSTQSPEFQQAYQSGLEFLQAVLRKDTGAAITTQEQTEYGRVYLPQPGDTPEIIAQKRVSRRRALEAIKAGMPPHAMLAQEVALQRSGPPASPPAPGGGAPPSQYRNPSTGEIVEWDGSEWVKVP